MRLLLELMARAVSRVPLLVLVLVAAGSGVLGWFASQVDVETDITEFAAESDTSRVFDRVSEEFGARGGSIQVVVDAGPAGNVLTADGLHAAERVVEVAETTVGVEERLQEDTDRSPAVVGFAAPVTAQLDAFDLNLDEVSDAFVAALASDVLGSPQGGQLEGLLSDDFDESGPTPIARGGLVVVNLDRDLNEGERREAAFALSDALDAEDFGWFDAEPFSFEILAEDIEEGMLEDLPLLLAVSFLLIIVILAFLFRRVSDVALGVGGLLLTIVWMQGFAVLLGPDYLGLTGPFNQIAIAVPVLLVGLGIDYSVHLTSRYTEERRRDAASGDAAATAVRTVGVALLLATITTVIGFLANVATPLPPIADFGVFAAAGIVSAFVVMGLLVPSSRNLLDRRRDARRAALATAAAREAAGPEGSGEVGASGPAEAGADALPSAEEIAYAGPVREFVARLPARVPVLLLSASVVLAAAGAVYATGIDTSFSQDEFIPEDSPSAELLDLQERLFGGDVSEQTFVLVDADFTAPETLVALADVEDRLAELDDVVAVGDDADVQSPRAILAQLERQIEATQEQLSAQLQLLADPDAGVDALPLPDDLTVDDLPDALLEDEFDDDLAASGLAGDMPIDDVDTGELEQRLPEGVSVEQALLSLVPGAELAGELRAAFAEQLDEEGPEGVSDDNLADLADLDPADLTTDALSARGYPLDDLGESTRELLDAVDDLAALGWVDGEITDDADTEGLYDLARDLLGGDLDGVVSEDRSAGLMIIGTQAGEERAEELAADLRAQLDPLEALGASASVASEQLLISETLDELTDAQTGAIIISLGAALALLVVYYTVTARRPALGFVTMVPPILAVPLILASMRLVGLAFNALTATVASIAVGIGVPYGIHLTNRYLEQRRRDPDPRVAIRGTVANTGAALIGSAVTTASAFGVLGLSNLEPIRQFGIVTSITILYALLAAIVAETSALVLWDRYHHWRDRRRGRPEPAADADGDSPVPGEAPALARADGAHLGDAAEGDAEVTRQRPSGRTPPRTDPDRGAPAVPADPRGG